MSAELMVMVRVLNPDKFKAAFAKTPVAVRNNMRSWLLSENMAFIGSKVKPGAFVRELQRKMTWQKNAAWKTQVTGLFKGKVVDPITGAIVSKTSLSSVGAGTGVLGGGISMKLQMGMVYRNKKKIHTAMEFLEEGGSISNSKYMPVPVKGADIGKAYSKFKYWLKAGMFTVVYKGGKAYYFLKSRGDSKDALMFVGLRRVSIKWHHSFHRIFDSQKIGLPGRGDAALDKAVRSVNG